MSHNYHKAHIYDGAYARIEDDGSLVLTAENGMEATDEVYFDSHHGVEFLLRYIKSNFPIQFSLVLKS